jgi:hypothetical protein
MPDSATIREIPESERFQIRLEFQIQRDFESESDDPRDSESESDDPRDSESESNNPGDSRIREIPDPRDSRSERFRNL